MAVLQSPARSGNTFTSNESFTYDGLGNILTNAGGWGLPPLASTYGVTNTYDAAGRLAQRVSAGSGGARTTTYSFDAGGNTRFEATRSTGSTTTVEERASYYRGDQRVAAVDRRSSGRRTLEEYRYDPLGRRVWVSTQTWCAPNSTVECLTSGVQRVLWDGETLLAEVRAPVVVGDPTVEERNTGFPAPRAVTLAEGPVEPSAFVGRVVYGPGRAVDQPVSVTRYEYADNPAGTPLVWPRFTWAVLWDYRGSPVAGVYTTGAWQRPYQAGPTQGECAP